MAQVMNYYRWPEGEINKGSLSGVTIQWDMLKDTYNSNDTSESAYAVADLMDWCGTSVSMSYSPSSSSASSYLIQEALVYYFNYDESIQRVFRQTYTAEEWDALIYNELENSRVVLYGIGMDNNSIGRHRCVCDGYDQNGFYHINWGWNGRFDGYFRLSLLDGWTLHHNAIINIKKGYSDFSNPSRPGFGKLTLHRYTINDDGDIVIDYGINIGGIFDDLEHDLALFQKDKLITCCKTSEILTGLPFIYRNQAVVSHNIPDGQYQLKVVCREKGTSEWIVPLMGDFHLLELNKYGSDITLQKKNYEEYLYGDCQVNNVSIEGNLLTDSEQKIIVNVTNISRQNALKLRYCCTLNDASIASGVLGLNIDPQSSGESMFYFTPTESGQHMIRFYKGSEESDLIKEYVMEVEETPVIITARNISRYYGDENPEFSFWTKGGKLKGEPSITCEATLTSNVGTYPIIVSQGTIKNSKVTYANGTLTIIESPLTIKPKDYTIMQYDALPDFEVEYNGFKNGETEDVLKKKPEIWIGISSTAEPGTYPIYAFDAEAENYIFSYREGYLTIKESPFKAYGSIENNTLTFYFDNHLENRANTVMFSEDKNTWVYYGSNDAIDKSAITTVSFDPSFAEYHGLSSLRAWFWNFNNLESINGLQYLNTENVRSMTEMFSDCDKLASLDLSHFDTHNVQTMYRMFGCCKALKELDLSSFNTQKVRTASYMFSNCSSLTTIYVGPEWSTENFINGDYMFMMCNQLKGGMGTTFYVLNTNYQYAHIDEGEENPGYFTTKPTAIVGDANGDNIVDVEDVMAIVNYILNKPGENFNEKAADVNGDGVIDVADVVAVVNIILKGGNANSPEAKAHARAYLKAHGFIVP